MKDCFGMNVDLSYFQWKFVNNPAGFVLGFIALSEEGEVAAYYGAIPESYMISGQLTTIYQSCDTMTHSRHRRKGLFQQLALHCYDYLRAENKLFVIGFGGGQSTPGFIKFGWQHTFDVRNYFYPRIFSFLRMSSDITSVSEITDYADIADIVLRSNQQAEIHSHKTLEVFKWRLANPLYKYKVIAYKPNPADQNYSSYLCYYIATNKVVLFDFHFQDSRAAKALMGYIKNIKLGSDAKGIIAFCQENSHYSRTLQKCGFLNNPFSKGPLSARTPFIFYTSDEGMKRYNVPGKWLINSFDHDAM
jgi:hypothetical protein